MLAPFAACVDITPTIAKTYLNFEWLLFTFITIPLSLRSVHPPPPSSDTMSIYMMYTSPDQLIPISNDGPSDLSLHCFNNDEEILEALTTSEYPWDNMHHRSFFLLEELVL